MLALRLGNGVAVFIKPHTKIDRVIIGPVAKTIAFCGAKLAGLGILQFRILVVCAGSRPGVIPVEDDLQVTMTGRHVDRNVIGRRMESEALRRRHLDR